MEATFPQISRSGNLSEMVAEKIKESILSGRYEPGDGLPNENQMTEQFGVSRVVIREALKELKSKGLIEIRRGPKGGPFVTQLDQMTFGQQFSDMLQLRQLTVGQLFQVRLLVEPEIVRLVLQKITDEQIEKLRATEARVKAETDPVKRKDYNQAFHRELGKLSGNPFYTFLMDSFMDFVDRVILVINPGTFNIHDPEIHGEIIEAIAARDEAKALTLIRAHLLDTRDKMMAQEKEYLSRSSNLGNAN